MSAQEAKETDALRELIDDGRVHVMDGAMGTELYACGVFVNVSYDGLNIETPDIVENVHRNYVNAGADPEMARKIVVNAKMRRTGICGATETLIIDRAAVESMLGPIVDDLIEAGCEVRGDADAQAADSRIVPATDEDWDTEYLDSIISVKVVDGVEDAIDHIERHGTNHTDCISTGNAEAAETFVKKVDSAIVLINASTQFADGGEFGMGAEIGISTGKLHARGPVGVEQLTSMKYVVRGEGQCRP